MIEAIQEVDQQWFLRLNGFHSPFFDLLMYWVTNKYTWFPLYGLLVVGVVLKFGWEGVRICVVLALVIIFCDQLTSGFMKPFFERPRPCHNPSIKPLVHLVQGCGGQYGFASSHAANTFGLATACWLFFRNWSHYFAWGFLWAAIVSYSRVYTGVHYPMDITVGAWIGVMLALLLYRLYRKFRPDIVRALPEKYR